MLAGKDPVIISCYYGCDPTTLCGEHLRTLPAENVFIPVLALYERTTVNLAVEGSEEPVTVTANHNARISTTLMIEEGPVPLRSVEHSTQ